MRCMHLSILEKNINSRAIVNAITQHGIPISHEKYLRLFLCQESACNLADIVAIYMQSDRLCIVGIKVNESNDIVCPKLAMDYLETYRNTCEYFYLAGKRFSQSMLEVKEVGLFDLTQMRTIKEAAYLSLDTEFKSIILRGVQKYFRTLPGGIEDPFQRTLGEFS